MTMWEADITYAWIRIIVATLYLQQSDAYKYNSWNYIKDEMGFFSKRILVVFYQTRVRSLATLVTNYLTNSVTYSCLVDLIYVTL